MNGTHPQKFVPRKFPNIYYNLGCVYLAVRQFYFSEIFCWSSLIYRGIQRNTPNRGFKPGTLNSMGWSSDASTTRAGRATPEIKRYHLFKCKATKHEEANLYPNSIPNPNFWRFFESKRMLATLRYHHEETKVFLNSNSQGFFEQRWCNPSIKHEETNICLNYAPIALTFYGLRG